MTDAADPAADAAIAAALLAIDPAGLGGAVLRGRPGPSRDRWLAHFQAALPAGTGLRKLPLGVPDSRLLGGIDLAATLRAGRPVAERGLLAEAHGGVLVAAMAERMEAGTAARLVAAMDTGAVSVARDGVAQALPARFAVLALDEGAEPDEHIPAALQDRLAFRIDAELLVPPMPQAAPAAGTVAVPDAVLDALCGTAFVLGIDSPRAVLLALAAARAAAAHAGRATVTEADATLAARLVLAPRATRLPPPDEAPDKTPPPPEEPPPDAPEATSDGQEKPLEDKVLDAARAAIPAGLLAQLQVLAPTRKGDSGRDGAARQATNRGQRIGTRPGVPRGGARLDLIETLRAAAPWQRLRAAETQGGPRVKVRKEDFRITRFRQRAGSTAIFVVDASGSAAAARLAEAKGAVETLLADCYVRRDQVALIAFRGRAAEILLPPTGALARARRTLAGLPGGGGTPLAAGLDAALALADAVRRRGRTPLLVLLTDGRANVARDGTGGRPQAEAEALEAARALRAQRFTALLVDTATRPQAFARDLAQAMAATYLPLPNLDPARLSRAVRAIE